MLSRTLLFASLLCSLQIIAVAISDPSQTVSRTITLHRKQLRARSAEDWGVWAKNEREALRVKYSDSPPSKRSEGTNL